MFVEAEAAAGADLLRGTFESWSDAGDGFGLA